jgi:hypothetical protein
MIRIVIITHVYDGFRERDFLLRSLAGHWLDAGHDVHLTEGLGNWPDGDVAIMHVDLSVVPGAYSAAAKRYPVVVNGAAIDVRKRLVSRYLVTRNDGWTGPVIVKTDLNYSGIPEKHAAECFRRDGKPADLPPGPIVATTRPYPIFASAGEVPADVWDNPGFVVERFLPEQDERGYCVRAWVFCGDRERCTRYRGTHPIVKSATIVGNEPVLVPDELRAERQRLGFDYGKFDFVVRDGRAILLDANRTPSAPPPNPEIEASNARLAAGIEGLSRRR